MNLIIRRKINYYFFQTKNWEAATFFSFLVYIIGVSYFHLSFYNYYLLSFIAIVQIHFWLSNQVESYEFTPNSLTYRFLFFKRNICLTSYQIVGIRYDNNPHNRRKENEFSESIFLQNEKFRFKIIKSNWELDDYEKIKKYIEKNFRNDSSIKKPFLIYKHAPDLTIFFILCFLFTSIFMIGVYLENMKNSNIDSFSYIESELSENSKLVTPKGSDYILFRLTKYPDYKFQLYESGFKELRKFNHSTQFFASDTIGLLIDIQDYQIKLKKYEKYPYFTSHLIPKKEISIKGIYYKNKYLLDQYDYSKGNSRNEKLRFLLPLLFVIIWISNIYSQKIKYAKTQ